MVQVMRVRQRAEKDKLLDHWRIVEVRNKVMGVIYSLMVEDDYTTEEVIEELKDISDTLLHVENDWVGLEHLVDLTLSANEENIKILKRKSAPEDTGAQHNQT